ncbi:MAG: glycosyltransferase family 4 protein [Bacteroidetes bacterium]|nr:glycosyltransferase family 4 protein [Bacteroidota bacterium]
MRIAILADPLDNQQAGIHVFTDQLLKALDATNSKHTYFVIRLQQTNQFQQLIEVPLKMPALWKGGRANRLFRQLPEKAMALHADVVVEPAHFGPFCLPQKVKRVTIIHDLTPLLFPEWHRWHSQMLQRVMLKGILKKAAIVITNSATTNADVISRFPFLSGKCNWIYPGNDHFFEPHQAPDILKQYTISQPYFLCTGTIEPRKNLDVVLEAFANYRQEEGNRHQLVIAGGKGWKTKSFYQKLQNHPYRDDIVLTGFVSKQHLRALYSMSLALIFPSRYEGFGLPLLEAMRCQTAVISSNRGSLSEVGGDACLFFNPDKPLELLKQMKAIAGDVSLRNDLIQRGCAREKAFSWEAAAKQFDGAMNHLESQP